MKLTRHFAVMLLTAASLNLIPAALVFSDDSVTSSSVDATPDSSEVALPSPSPGATPPAYLFDEIDLNDAPLRDALSLIGNAAGVNFAASNDAAQTKVTVHLRNVTAYQAVQVICETNGLYFKKPTPTDIGILTTIKEFQDGLTVFRQENTEVFTLLYPNAIELAVAIHDLYGDRVKFSIGAEGVYDESDALSQRFSTFDQLDERGQSISLSGSNGSSGSSSGGFGGSSSGNSGNSNGSFGGNSGGGVSSLGSGLSSLTSNQNGPQNQTDQQVVQNLSPQELNRIATLVRQQGAGVGVDTATLSSLGHNNATIYVTVINRNNQVIVRTSDPDVLTDVESLKKIIDIPTPQVLLEVKVLSVDLTDGFNSVFDYQFSQGPNSIGFSTGGGSLGGPGEPAGSPFALNPTSLIYQYVSDQFQARMQLLESHNKVTELATPLLLVANNEVSKVFVGQERPIVQNISSQTNQNLSGSNTSGTTNFNFEPVGTTLLITPNINADRTVTLRLIEEQSSIISNGANIPIVSTNGAIVNQPVDVVSATTLTGTLVAKDGLSLALGGLIDETVQDQREEVPSLGKLPVLGFLFRRQSTGRTRNEVIVVIRPFILSTPSEAEATSKRLTDAISLHPKAPDLYPPDGQPIGTMHTFLPYEVVRPDPPKNQLEGIFHFYNVLPTDY